MENVMKHLRETDINYKHIRKSIVFSYKKYPEKFLYYYNVWKFTESNKQFVPDISFRGNDYHLDHIIPISIGYKYNLDPIIIGSSANLRIIDRRKNLLKGCKITEDTLKVLSDFGIDLSQIEPLKIVKYTPLSPEPNIDEVILKSDNPKSLLYYIE